MQSLTISLIHKALVKQNSQLGIFEDASLTLEKGITANWAGGASQKLVFLWPGSQDSAEMGVSFCREEFVGWIVLAPFRSNYTCLDPVGSQHSSVFKSFNTAKQLWHVWLQAELHWLPSPSKERARAKSKWILWVQKDQINADPTQHTQTASRFWKLPRPDTITCNIL